MAIPIELTHEQTTAADRILTAVRNQTPLTTLGGFAGSGKSTLISFMVSELSNIAVCAYTGKAANVLRKKGVPATTIHSLIYIPAGQDSKGERYWTRRRREDLQHYSAIIVDEASMVDGDIFDDLKSFNLPIVAVGDHGQLEPVKSKFNLMQDPEIRLETIHRNAGLIAQFADAVRMGDQQRKRELLRADTTRTVVLGPRDMLNQDAWIKYVDQVCCAFNKTRVKLNLRKREMLGYTTPLPVAGERIICLQNNRRLGLFNGQQGVLTNIDYADSRLDFQPDALPGHEYTIYGVKYDPLQWGKAKSPTYEEKPNGERKNPFDYAYALTAHKLQGDEADSVMVFVERNQFGSREPLWDQKRWEYTAATRARKQLVWVER